MYNMSHSVYINIYESADKVCTMTIVFKIHKIDFFFFFFLCEHIQQRAYSTSVQYCVYYYLFS